MLKIGQILKLRCVNIQPSGSVLSSKHYPDLHLSFLQPRCQNLAQNIHISQWDDSKKWDKNHMFAVGLIHSRQRKSFVHISRIRLLQFGNSPHPILISMNFQKKYCQRHNGPRHCFDNLNYLSSYKTGKFTRKENSS